MANEQKSQKKVLIDQANKRVILSTSIATFVVIFSLVAAHALFGQLLYQNRIASAKKQALSQLKKNEATVSNLATAYTAFVASPQNVIGGNSTGTAQNDGDNAKIVLDALPSKYDFPALATSLEKLMTDQGVQIQNISGTDDEVAQSAPVKSGTSQPVAMPFQLSGSGSLAAVEKLTTAFEASIRPIQLQTMTLTGSNNNLTLNVGAQSYYQPAKIFTVGKKVIK